MSVLSPGHLKYSQNKTDPNECNPGYNFPSAFMDLKITLQCQYKQYIPAMIKIPVCTWWHPVMYWSKYGPVHESKGSCSWTKLHLRLKVNTKLPLAVEAAEEERSCTRFHPILANMYRSKLGPNHQLRLVFQTLHTGSILYQY